MGLAVRNRRAEAFRDGAALEAEAQAPPSGASRDETGRAPFPHADARGPAEAAAGDERRGPMRPGRPSPSRSRLNGWTLSAVFRGADIVAIAATVIICTRVLDSSPSP